MSNAGREREYDERNVCVFIMRSYLRETAAAFSTRSTGKQPRRQKKLTTY